MVILCIYRGWKKFYFFSNRSNSLALFQFYKGKHWWRKKIIHARACRCFIAKFNKKHRKHSIHHRIQTIPCKPFSLYFFPYLSFLSGYTILTLRMPWKICCPRLTAILSKVNYVLGPFYNRVAAVTSSLLKLICSAVNIRSDRRRKRDQIYPFSIYTTSPRPRLSKITQ